ncbi:Protein of unknown function (DUF3608) [Nesidiocoris tenuis]|uniref:DEP domain-containing protein n=1 Tax=Nesidiocoris tenuis TaxID=355587 RepID=A0ABN7B0Z0_9HEMI|nr:Protein of unknown function (DUF3608) [Nesidiocoris tenuis]
MKLYKVLVHNKGFSPEDLLINPKDFPNLRIGDIVEIYHPQDEFSRLLLQVTLFKDDMQGRDAISVEQSVAATFQLRTYWDIIVNVVNPDTVTLDLVEIIFKDQYMGRSEMWRLKNSLVNTCVFLNKKLEFCGGSVRCQVSEMWAQGDRVACGVISDTTKIVFRSSTSMVYLFLQMSSEMWDFDIYGDLYFEKMVNGFLTDLFQKWKNQGSNHEVTIVLFSRTFYQASSLDEFPKHMRECLQRDYKGRFYEDFYRVAVQNERYEDWSHVLNLLRKLFCNYEKSVLEYNNRPGVTIPKAVNSTAAQGNFLEVLNMSLNVFEKHYLDRSFDRTGQLSVVITPGVGVFEVDRELTNVTKQRVIDNGVGSDLVCLGEQPLHAVPLFKYHNKDSSITGDDYSMPHWINLSFFSSNKRLPYSNFVPRIKLPPKKPSHKAPGHGSTPKPVSRSKALNEEDDLLANAVVDYDAYDLQVFEMPHSQNSKSSRAQKKTSMAGIETATPRPARRKLSDPDIHYASNSTLNDVASLSKSPAIEIPARHRRDTASSYISSTVQSDHTCRRSGVAGLGSETDSPPSRLIVGSTGSTGLQYQIGNPPVRPGRALINPFDPSHITIKLTSNRRRWTHIFPKGPTGNLIQQHHYQANAPNVASGSGQSPQKGAKPSAQDGKSKPRSSIYSLPGWPSQMSNKKSALLWGVTGEQEWTSALTTGVDWKSLTIPACLPITTDYFPDDVCLRTDYVFSDYNLLPDAVNADYARQRIIYRKPLQTLEVFQELISQRLAQGFQLIVDDNCGSQLSIAGGSGSVVAGSRGKSDQVKEYKLSIGRIFHRITLTGSEIGVTRYRPRHPYPPFNFHYWYRFQAPDHATYVASWISFSTEKLENFNWNYFDHYICTRGDADFALIESLKYWRFRIFVLPACPAPTRKILEGASQCDLYNGLTIDEQQSLVENFLKYIEAWINKIKRPQTQKKPRSNVVGNSPFRERLGSNRVPEKFRPRSGSKVLERTKASQSVDVPLMSSADGDQAENGRETAKLVLTPGSEYQELAEHMKNPNTGVGFLIPLPSLPKYAFVSVDAVHWIKNRVDGIKDESQAIKMLQGMLDAKYICHASGDSKRPFIYGFYLYHIKTSKEELKDGESLPVGDLAGFENEWMEVEVERNLIGSKKPAFFSAQLPEYATRKRPVPTFKESHLEMDVQGKSDRVEWGHIKYHSVYNPNMAYEIAVQWAAASGAIVADLIFGWARKAQTCGLQIVPIPADPFSLPCSLKSDPLRGPIFVPVNIDCLTGPKSQLFEEFEESTRSQRTILFLEAIALKFGFLRCAVKSEPAQPHQYVHLSGNIFLLIPSHPCEHPTTPSQLQVQPPKFGSSPDPSASPRHEFVSRLVGTHSFNHETRIGFLWSKNHMVSRRWKLGPTCAASDDNFVAKLYNDFMAFCRNENDRLMLFWSSCKETVGETTQ